MELNDFKNFFCFFFLKRSGFKHDMLTQRINAHQIRRSLGDLFDFLKKKIGTRAVFLTKSHPGGSFSAPRVLLSLNPDLPVMPEVIHDLVTVLERGSF